MAMRILDELETQRKREIHLKRLQNMKPLIDNKQPRLVQRDARKTEFVRKEREAKIRHENLILLEKMTKINNSRTDFDKNALVADLETHVLFNENQRRKKNREIMEQNQLIKTRIENSIPYYNSQKWQNEHDHHLALVRFHTRASTSKKITGSFLHASASTSGGFARTAASDISLESPKMLLESPRKVRAQSAAPQRIIIPPYRSTAEAAGATTVASLAQLEQYKQNVIIIQPTSFRTKSGSNSPGLSPTIRSPGVKSKSNGEQKRALTAISKEPKSTNRTLNQSNSLLSFSSSHKDEEEYANDFVEEKKIIYPKSRDNDAKSQKENKNNKSVYSPYESADKSAKGETKSASETIYKGGSSVSSVLLIITIVAHSGHWTVTAYDSKSSTEYLLDISISQLQNLSSKGKISFREKDKCISLLLSKLELLNGSLTLKLK